MAYKQGYTNIKNLLADFIDTICFDELATEKFENWELVYPKLTNREEIYNWILENNTVTISSISIPKSKWQNNETFKINQEYLNTFSDDFIINNEIRPIFEIPLEKSIYNLESVKLKIKGHKGIFYNNDNLNSLGIMEFYVDKNNKKIILLKETIKLLEYESFNFLISYQTFANDPITWYVDFNYPPPLNEISSIYCLEWHFGKEIDKNFKVINKKVTPPRMQCHLHTGEISEKNKKEWIPIEYFISWDDSAISFVFSEDPIGNIKDVIHSFNYIGILESFESADNDDIESNFGSCGNYGIISQIPIGTIEETFGVVKANLIFIESHYDSYFNKINERILLKLNNVLYGNYVIDEVMKDDKNLLQPLIQQFIIGDVSVPYSNPSPAKDTFNDQVISRHNIMKKGTTNILIIPSETQINLFGGPSIETVRLSKNSPINISNGIPIIIPQQIADILLISDTIVWSIYESKSITLSANTKIKLENNFSTSFINTGLYNLSSNIILKDENNLLYRTISTTQIFTNKIRLTNTTSFTFKNDTTVLKPHPISIIAEDIIIAGTSARLVSSFIDIDLIIVEDYIIEFQYREPFKGSMHYDFPTKWFDGTTTKDFNNIDGNTPLLVPIVAEPMIIDSTFENEEIINDEFNEPFKGKQPVLNRLSFTESGINYHKNKIIVPKIITNIRTGESWFLEEINVISGVEKTDDSITNICMYPYQTYVGNFCYRKEANVECIITLGEFDIDRMRFVLTDSNNNVLVDFYNTQVYKNLTIIRNSDNGVTLKVDISNLNSEKLYLKMYKKNNYLSDDSGVFVNTCDTNCGVPAVDHGNGWWSHGHSGLDSGYDHGIKIFFDLKISTCPIDIKLKFDYGLTSEDITHFFSTKTDFSSSVSTSTLYFSPTGRLIHVNEMVAASGLSIPSGDNWYKIIPIHDFEVMTGDIIDVECPTFLEIDLGTSNQVFIPKIISGVTNTNHIWL